MMKFKTESYNDNIRLKLDIQKQISSKVSILNILGNFIVPFMSQGCYCVISLSNMWWEIKSVPYS